MGYSLRPGLSFCRVEGQLIFLDRHRDRYFGLARSIEQSFEAMLAGQPADPGHAPVLVRQSLLVDRPGKATSIGPVQHRTASRSLLANTVRYQPMRETLPAALRQLRSRRLLHKIGLDRFLARFEQLHRPTIDDECPDLDQVSHVARKHDAAVVFAAAHGRCLPNAHAIGCELAQSGFDARLIFGVKLYPFEAHCWVELDDMVVNDRIDAVRSFTPILVV